MATHTLTADTLISTLMPSGGGSLASGDTINLSGRSLIVDADAVDYPVTIANSGVDANLELRDLGRIKLNATLPANVNPYIDPAHPLPVSAEPGIDGDPYRTNLTANARAEIQLNGNFSLGGGAAILPTETRDGPFWSKVVSWANNTSCTLARPMPLHVGDLLMRCGSTAAWGVITFGRVASYNETTLNVTFSESVGSGLNAGDALGIVAGGVVLYRPYHPRNCVLVSPCNAGTLNFVSVGSTDGWGNGLTESTLRAHRVGMATYGAVGAEYQACGICGVNSSVVIEEAVAHALCFVGGANPVLSASAIIGELAATGMASLYPVSLSGSSVRVGGGYLREYLLFSSPTYAAGGGCGVFASLSGMELGAYPNTGKKGGVELNQCTVGGNPVDSKLVTSSGTVTRTERGGWYMNYHAPATATDSTWSYTDRTVAPGATLRLACTWSREGGSATRASVAITDTATWWPQLWLVGENALSSTEFSGVAESQQLLTWRNTGTEARQVRVWECVTGSTGGGYLKVEEVKGGAL